MNRLRRILTAPFRLLYWLNYGDPSVYQSEKASDSNRVRTRPPSQAELGRTTRQIGNAAASEHRIKKHF